MKCRNLSEKSHDIIWFGKDFEKTPTQVYYILNEKFGSLRGYTNAPDSQGRILINKTYYNFKLNDNSTINGKITTRGLPDDVGVGSLTNEKKLPNYVEDTDSVVVSLIQRLSVIKGELWWQVNYGMPLTDKVRGTTLYDMVVTDIITSHPGVASIQSYSSNLVGHTYTYTCTIKTVFGDTATISN